MKQILILTCAIAALSLVSTPARAAVASWNTPSSTPRPAPTANGWLWPTRTNFRARKRTGANPSEKLARTDGVICPPPDIDPDIHARAPGGGRTPVIPPAAVEPGTQAK